MIELGSKTSVHFAFLQLAPRLLESARLNSGIQKWALVAYITLSVYFLAKPSPQALSARAESLDKALAGQSAAALSPALAAALDIPAPAVDQFLRERGSKPSALVFNKLLHRPNSQTSEDFTAEAVLKSGMTSEAAIAYFDTVEHKVAEFVAKTHTASFKAAPESASYGKPLLGSRPD